MRAAFQRIGASAKEKRPDAHIEGATVERMITAREGFEMILGAKTSAP